MATENLLALIKQTYRNIELTILFIEEQYIEIIMSINFQIDCWKTFETENP